jgi:hypothetical protein
MRGIATGPARGNPSNARSGVKPRHPRAGLQGPITPSRQRPRSSRQRREAACATALRWPASAYPIAMTTPPVTRSHNRQPRPIRRDPPAHRPGQKIDPDPDQSAPAGSMSTTLAPRAANAPEKVPVPQPRSSAEPPCTRVRGQSKSAGQEWSQPSSRTSARSSCRASIPASCLARSEG